MTTARLKFDFHYGRLLLDRELQFSFSERTNIQSRRFRIFFFVGGGGGGGGTWVSTLLETYIKLNLAN